MKIERQYGRTIADQDLHIQLVAIAHAANGLDLETGKVLMPGKIFQRGPLPMRAAGKEQAENGDAGATCSKYESGPSRFHCKNIP